MSGFWKLGYIFSSALPQKCNKAILLLASMDKYGIALFFY